MPYAVFDLQAHVVRDAQPPLRELRVLGLVLGEQGVLELNAGQLSRLDRFRRVAEFGAQRVQVGGQVAGLERRQLLLGLHANGGV